MKRWALRSGLVLAGALLSANHLHSALQDEEAEVKACFESFQAALKAKDPGKIWKLLDADSRDAAERAAKAIKAAYAKASAEKKAAWEKALGLPGAELTKLTGEGYLKTKRFLGKYDEVPESKIDKIDVKADKATVHYIEADGDKEKFYLRLEGKVWKLSVPIPAVGKP